MLGLVWLKYLKQHLYSEMAENKIKEREKLSMWSTVHHLLGFVFDNLN